MVPKRMRISIQTLIQRYLNNGRVQQAISGNVMIGPIGGAQISIKVASSVVVA